MATIPQSLKRRATDAVDLITATLQAMNDHRITPEQAATILQNRIGFALQTDDEFYEAVSEINHERLRTVLNGRTLEIHFVCNEKSRH